MSQDELIFRFNEDYSEKIEYEDKLPDAKECFAEQTLVALIDNRILDEAPKDDDTLVFATKWDNFQSRKIQILKPEITLNKHYISLKHLGSVDIEDLKQLPSTPSSPNDHNLEGSWLRYLGREYKGFAQLLKHDMVVYGTSLPLAAQAEYYEKNQGRC